LRERAANRTAATNNSAGYGDLTAQLGRQQAQTDASQAAESDRIREPAGADIGSGYGSSREGDGGSGGIARRAAARIDGIFDRRMGSMVGMGGS
jgi:hypothetical protein